MRSENALPGSFLILLALVGMSDASGDAPYIDPVDDEAHFGDINIIRCDTLSIYEQLRLKRQVDVPGEVFNYNTAETNLVGTLLRAAVGNNLSTYLSAKIWQPFGMEFDAAWNLSERNGGEFGGSRFNQPDI